MSKKKETDENIASKRNEDWWRLEKSQIGRKKFSQIWHITVMEYACYIRQQKYLHQKNTRVGKKDALCVQFLLKPQILDVLVVMPSLEENQDQTKTVEIRSFINFDLDMDLTNQNQF